MNGQGEPITCPICKTDMIREVARGMGAVAWECQNGHNFSIMGQRQEEAPTGTPIPGWVRMLGLIKE